MAIGRKTGGRQKGTPNKLPRDLKAQILAGLERAHKDGPEAYFAQQARDNPAAFMALIGKVLPTTLTSDPNSPLKIVYEWAQSPSESSGS